MLAEHSPDEQSDVGPTLASNVGPTELTTLSQRWPNVVMLSGVSCLLNWLKEKKKTTFMFMPCTNSVQKSIIAAMLAVVIENHLIFYIPSGERNTAVTTYFGKMSFSLK